MGNWRQKWTKEEEEALKAGVAKHGAGKWKRILLDSELSPIFIDRSNVDLKDKWRNMCVSQGQICRDNTTTPKARESVSSSRKKANDHPPQSTRNMKNVRLYNPLIFDALSSLGDPNGSDTCSILEFIVKKYEVTFGRRLLSTMLMRLVVQNKLEKIQHCYKMKDVVLATKTPSPKQKDVRPKPLLTIDVRPKPMQTIFREMKAVEDAAKTAARWISEAENTAFLMFEAVKESERVSQMAEDADAMLTLAQEFYVKCSGDDGYILVC